MRRAALKAKKRAVSKTTPVPFNPISVLDLELSPTPVAIDSRPSESVAGFSDRTGLPEIRMAYRCSDEELSSYDALLRHATEVRLLVAPDVIAVDLMQQETVLGRMMTSVLDDRLWRVADAVRDGAEKSHVSIHRDTIVEPEEDADLQLPVSLQNVSNEDIFGKPTIEGAGPVVATIVNTVSGHHTLRRFATDEEAEAEAARRGGLNAVRMEWEFPRIWDYLLLYDDITMGNARVTALGGGAYQVEVRHSGIFGS